MSENEASVGVFVHNEEENMAKVLDALIKQKTDEIKIKEIIVVDDGSTDRTNPIAKSFEKKDKKIKVITLNQRGGKMAAINVFLGKMKGQIAVIESGDTIPDENCVEELCKPFLRDEKLGMTGVRAIPTNDKNTFLGYVVHYWWWMSFMMPRVGEMIAYRHKLLDRLPPNASIDEAWIEAIVSKKGYKIRTIGSAIIANRGADNVKDMIKQRKRNYIAHKHLVEREGYHVTSFDFGKMARLTLKYLAQEPSLKHMLWLIGGAAIEFYSRARGLLELKLQGADPIIWEIAHSTKKVR